MIRRVDVLYPQLLYVSFKRIIPSVVGDVLVGSEMLLDFISLEYPQLYPLVNTANL